MSGEVFSDGASGLRMRFGSRFLALDIRVVGLSGWGFMRLKLGVKGGLRFGNDLIVYPLPFLRLIGSSENIA